MEVRLPATGGLRRRGTYLGCLFIAAALLLVCTKSSPLYPLNDWVDVNIYFTIGKGMFQGAVPYRDLYDQKGPVVYLLYGLCSLISGKTFFGVWMLEIFSFSAFLYTVCNLLSLWTDRSPLPYAALLGALLLPAMSISHGGSLEQVCLPVFGYGLYSAVRYYRFAYPARPKLSMVLVNGLFAGLLLFAKFTMLAFYFAWMAVLALSLFARKDWGYGLACCGVFLCAMLLTGLPWLVYFQANGALGDFFHYYFYSNLFGYSYIDPPVLPNTLLAILRGTGASFFRNPQYSPLIALGFVWLTFSKKARPVEKISLWALGAFTACGAFLGGQNYRYYGIPLMAFAALGLVPLLRLWEGWVLPRLEGKPWTAFARRTAFLWITLLGVGLALLTSDNVYLLGYPRQETPQARFAAKMETVRREEETTLLCRAFPDSGFYLAADVIPACRFFTSTNVPLPEISAEQLAHIQTGIPEFVVMRERADPPGPGYACIDSAGLFYEGEIRTYYLYQREEDFHVQP